MNYNELDRISKEEIRDIELNLLDEFDSFCKDHDLKYVLDGGTLLGAVRHKGFIPWDDDMDVVMPYPDYLKFLELYSENENLKGIPLHGKQYGFHYTKFCDKRTLVKSGHRSDDRLYGVWIDVFPMYSIDNDDEQAMKDIQDVLSYGKKSWGYLGSFSRNPMKNIYHKIFDQYNLNRCLDSIQKILTKYPYGSTNRLRVVPIVSRKLAATGNNHFDDRIKLNFENRMYFAPKEYDKYLKSQFGDYMKLPSEKDRISHNIEAYWK